jgi:hypothetical protein
MRSNAATAPTSAHGGWLWLCAVGPRTSDAGFAVAPAVGSGRHATSWWPLGCKRHAVEAGYGASRVRLGRLARISDAVGAKVECSGPTTPGSALDMHAERPQTSPFAAPSPRP